ncbi:ABC transporter ATP-binding protein [Clostridium tertium]|jgi:cobalt/nickel transport system ATP-binding protein|uniref:Energy-coupling factor ABC transporter ATP-binding protein n=1 Tax=Clostridium tertium TaxID=1559 RepID=A0A9X3XK37_9CLOT|nr:MULTISPECIES: ABC transporter ATP-binding protein [Clostridium]MDB1924303.1 ABC transporter ATP-binding protein [Clostridium tertium]MDB1927604.1 ABC transporter ATP-binding protein [Clostridium tertium]MDB1931202.1 ABC transporter ATP-binding protein [Clostridium tertium]MDC4240358.1 energy-coupling factor ABC transporter ATP-binding protein [Clostridium tertium]MDU2681602.1 ABC transporter ATP-binding protein [Clostridium sp.]
MSHININVENLSFSYEKEQPILKNITFTAKENDSIGIIGANGVGKSTLLKLLVGLNLNYEGSIRVENIPVEKNTLSIIRERIGYVFQDSDNQLFMSNVYEDIAFAPRNYGFSEEEVKKRVENALNIVHINNLKNKKIYKLSGGEKKLVSIATIFSMTPDIILMDEPSIALDPKNRRNLINILNEFQHLKIIASHDLDMILDTCNRTILMSEGKIIKDGNTKDILTDKKLLEANNLELPFCFQEN